MLSRSRKCGINLCTTGCVYMFPRKMCTIVQEVSEKPTSTRLLQPQFVTPLSERRGWQLGRTQCLVCECHMREKTLLGGCSMNRWVTTGYLSLTRPTVTSGEKKTLHSTVRPLHVAAAVSLSADASLHQDPCDFQPPRGSAPYEGALQDHIGLKLKQHRVMQHDNHPKQTRHAASE